MMGDLFIVNILFIMVDLLNLKNFVIKFVVCIENNDFYEI